MASSADMTRGLNLLSFDGGGITGLSSLLLLKEVMSRLQIKAGMDRRSDPWEHFDLIGGTGTGAICAVMLGRLKMSVDDAIKTYAELASKVYSDRKMVVSRGSGMFRATKMEECLKAIIQKQTGDPDERMMEEDPRDVKCKVVVYAMSAHNMNAGLPCPFRTYPANANAMPDCPIWKALRASTAHPELFKSIEIGELGVGQHYIGGGLGCGNPTSQLLKEASSVYPDRPVGSVVSIGTGHARTIQMTKPTLYQRLWPRSIPRVLQVTHDLAMDNEKVAEEMATRFSEARGVYHRLNVNQGAQSVEPSEWGRQNEIAGHTAAYMLQAETSRLIDAIVDGVHRKDRIAKTHQIGETILSFELRRHCPPPTPLFTGRTHEIEIIKNYFEQNPGAQNVFVLLGLGGAGKTQMALKSAEVMTPRLEGILFIDGASRQSMETALGAFAASKHVGNAYMDALVWLGSRNARWLIIFDNVDDPKVRVHEYFPRGAKYRILITTRHVEVARLAQDKSARFNVSELNPGDGYRLLLKAAGLNLNGLQGSEKSAATAILQKLGHLALAISHCGAYICRNKCTIAEYHDMLVAEPQEMLGINESATAKIGGYELSVHLTWEISYKQVSLTSKRVLGLATFLHRDRISQDIFRRAYLNAGSYRPAVPPTHAEAGAQREVMDILQLFVDRKGNWSSRLFIEAMGELVCLSLVTFDTMGHVYQLHPLVQEWTRALAPETSVAIERSAFLLALSIDQGTRSEDHAFRLSALPLVNETMTLCPTPNSNNAWQFIKVYEEADQVNQYEQLELQVLKTRIDALGREHPATLEVMRYVAGTHSHKGRLEQAAELYSEVLIAQRRVLGINHTDTLTTIRELGRTYRLQGRLAGAEALQIETLAARTRLLGDEHLDTLHSTADLAGTYNLLGRLAEAEALDKDVLAARKRVLGDDHPHTLASRSNLAVGYYNQGRYAEAEALQLEAISAEKRVLGDTHPDTLISNECLALTYYEQGRLAEAEVLQVKVLIGRRGVLGSSHPDTLRALRNLAYTYRAQGRDAEFDRLRAQVDPISAS